MQYLGLILLIPWLAGAQSSKSLTNPTSIPCPSNVTLVRSAGPPGNQSLSSAETEYIANRAETVLPGAWKTYFQNVNSSSPTTLPDYVSSILTGSSNGSFPKLGIAVSGGGYRAALFGAGALNSLDARNATSARIGSGGILQAASYIASLSGGSWLVTALAQANFPTISALLFPNQNVSAAGGYGGFNAQVDLINPGPTANATLAYLEEIIAEIIPKNSKAHLPITITDMWSRALSRHFVNGTTAQNVLIPGTHGAGILFSDIASVPSFKSRSQPFPIVVVDSFSPHPNASEFLPGNVVPFTNEIWEFNVFESGSFDPTLASFIPTSLLGSTNSSHCIAGFDQASYIAAVSSNLFPNFNTSAAALAASPAASLIELISATFPNQVVRLDSAAVPNPFKGVNPSTYSNTNETFVSLIDGGSDGQGNPFLPLLVRAREVDTMIAFDADKDDADNFTNGTEVIASARRASLYGDAYPFPSVPASSDIFVQQNLTRRPTFFGCNDSSNTPMIIYIANGGPPANGAAPVTNTSTFQTTYTADEVSAFLEQAFEISTQGAPVGGNTTDPAWGACLACAVVDRARARTGVARQGICTTCFQRYCWFANGTTGGGSKTGGSNKIEIQKSAVVTVSLAVMMSLILGLDLFI